MIVTKRLDLTLLEQQLLAAGVVFRHLATVSTLIDTPGVVNLLTYNMEGMLIELPPEAVPVVDAHVAPADPDPPDYGTDEPGSDFRVQAAQIVQQARGYLNNPAPTNAQNVAALKMSIRVLLFIIRYLLAPPPLPLTPPGQ